MRVPRHPNGEHALWQRRFWEHTIRNEKDFERHIDYTHFNPVKHARDWPYSSFHRDVAREIVPLDWAGDIAADGEFGEAR